MKVVLLVGGFGTRISEETHLKPKPMVEVGGKPILWHIMKLYSFFGLNDFILCLGYKGNVIKDYFLNYSLYQSNLTIDMRNEESNIFVHQNNSEKWKITLLDTGLNTLTGGRIRRIKEFVQGETFCLTYGDGLSNINIEKLLRFHQQHGKLATITAVQPPGRFGSLQLEGNRVINFDEKPVGDGRWINGGFFVLHSRAIDYITEDGMYWEDTPLTQLAKDNQLVAYKHRGFWQPMDTLRDKNKLQSLWEQQNAPWKVW